MSGFLDGTEKFKSVHFNNNNNSFIMNNDLFLQTIDIIKANLSIYAYCILDGQVKQQYNQG